MGHVRRTTRWLSSQRAETAPTPYLSQARAIATRSNGPCVTTIRSVSSGATLQTVRARWLASDVDGADPMDADVPGIEDSFGVDEVGRCGDHNPILDGDDSELTNRGAVAVSQDRGRDSSWRSKAVVDRARLQRCRICGILIRLCPPAARSLRLTADAPRRYSRRSPFSTPTAWSARLTPLRNR